MEPFQGESPPGQRNNREYRNCPPATLQIHDPGESLPSLWSPAEFGSLLADNCLYPDLGGEHGQDNRAEAHLAAAEAVPAAALRSHSLLRKTSSNSEASCRSSYDPQGSWLSQSKQLPSPGAVRPHQAPDQDATDADENFTNFFTLCHPDNMAIEVNLADLPPPLSPYAYGQSIATGDYEVDTTIGSMQEDANTGGEPTINCLPPDGKCPYISTPAYVQPEENLVEEEPVLDQESSQVSPTKVHCSPSAHRGITTTNSAQGKSVVDAINFNSIHHEWDLQSVITSPQSTSSATDEALVESNNFLGPTTPTSSSSKRPFSAMQDAPLATTRPMKLPPYSAIRAQHAQQLPPRPFSATRGQQAQPLVTNPLLAMRPLRLQLESQSATRGQQAQPLPTPTQLSAMPALQLQHESQSATRGQQAQPLPTSTQFSAQFLAMKALRLQHEFRLRQGLDSMNPNHDFSMKNVYQHQHEGQQPLSATQRGYNFGKNNMNYPNQTSSTHQQLQQRELLHGIASSMGSSLGQLKEVRELYKTHYKVPELPSTLPLATRALNTPLVTRESHIGQKDMNPIFTPKGFNERPGGHNLHGMFTQPTTWEVGSGSRTGYFPSDVRSSSQSGGGAPSSPTVPAPAAKLRRKHGTATDPQSTAARVRRGKFTERVGILQHLVPHAERLDTVSTLGQALSYVKFLQHQVTQLLPNVDAQPLPTLTEEERAKWKEFEEFEKDRAQPGGPLAPAAP